MDNKLLINPIVRWAGSKRKLADRILPFFPLEFDRYVEPFLGSGAIALKLQPKRALLSDGCRELVETYKAVRDNPDAVLRYLRPLKISEQKYYKVRNRLMASPDRFERAAEFIYLNKSCWNGLYRVNKAGRFNVPFGAPKSAFVYDEADIRNFAEFLGSSAIRLSSRDFGRTLAWCRDGDFVFLDPPYVTKHNYNGFAEWNETIFSWEDQVRLRDEVVRLDSLGAAVLVTNANHVSIRDLYSGFRMNVISRSSTLASNSAARGPVEELVITNYEV